MMWDVMGGVSRRAWARNSHSIETAMVYNQKNVGKAHVTLPYIPQEALVDQLVGELFKN